MVLEHDNTGVKTLLNIVLTFATTTLVLIRLINELGISLPVFCYDVISETKNYSLSLS